MKTIYKIDIHRVEQNEDGETTLKYMLHPEVSIHGDKADVLSVMDIFTRQGYAVVVFPPIVKVYEEEDEE